MYPRGYICGSILMWFYPPNLACPHSYRALLPTCFWGYPHQDLQFFGEGVSKGGGVEGPRPHSWVSGLRDCLRVRTGPMGRDDRGLAQITVGASQWVAQAHRPSQLTCATNSNTVISRKALQVQPMPAGCTLPSGPPAAAVFATPELPLPATGQCTGLGRCNSGTSDALTLMIRN